MAYFSPYIDSAGLHIPTYADIRDQLVDDAKSIYGNDIYLEIDSADYQFISAVSLKMYDSMLAIQLAYNNRSPQTAIGSGLDAVVLLNGIARLPAARSTCQVTVYGKEGTFIMNGRVADDVGNLWLLPVFVTIPDTGSIEVSAICETPGPVTADVGAIKSIETPTAGWLSVDNLVSAIPGKVAETDAELRSRQALSVALPSQTLLEGTLAGILSVANVSRVRVYENDTNRYSGEGFPPHSITAVVEGGADEAVAQQIFAHKGVGGYTNGTTSVVITDAYGQPNAVRFYRPRYVPIHVTVNLHRLQGWEPPMVEQIKVAISSYLNSLRIGDDVTISSLWGAVLGTVLPDLRAPAFSISLIKAGKYVSSQYATDLNLLFNEAAQGDVSRVIVNVS